jgi:hypothetical protein
MFRSRSRRTTFLIAGLALGAGVAASVVITVSHDPSGGSDARFVGDQTCISCHQPQGASFHLTAHANTSRLPTADSVEGSFKPGANVLLTSNPELHFRMDAVDGRFSQTAVWRNSPDGSETRTESIDLVIGSGRKGLSFLYWDDDRLFQLPVSHWTEHDAWVNSPGFKDGEAKFDRGVGPRCLECHATSFESRPPPENRFAKDSLVLGIRCEKCHGPGGEHTTRMRTLAPAQRRADRSIVNPARLTRKQQTDLCALCHAGGGYSITPALTYQVGDDLDDHLRFTRLAPDQKVDVHGDQLQLLERSRCYQASPTMTCTTCHNVHQPQREPESFAARCLTCHQIEDCGEFPRRQLAIATACVTCHMPLERTEKIISRGPENTMQPRARNHQIAIYPEVDLP